MNIFLFLADDEQLDVTTVVELLRLRFPQSVVTAHNSFEAERERARENIAKIAATGRPLNNPQLILRPIDGREERMGPGVDVTITLDANIAIEGYIWRKQMALKSQTPLSDEHLAMITGFLESLSVGRIETVLR